MEYRLCTLSYITTCRAPFLVDDNTEFYLSINGVMQGVPLMGRIDAGTSEVPQHLIFTLDYYKFVVINLYVFTIYK